MVTKYSEGGNKIMLGLASANILTPNLREFAHLRITGPWIEAIMTIDLGVFCVTIAYDTVQVVAVSGPQDDAVMGSHQSAIA